MKSKMFKIFISIVLVVSLSLAITTSASAAYSPLKQRFAAGIASALLALNVTLESSLAPYQKLLDNLAEPINTSLEYTFPMLNWEDDIMDKSTIQIWKDYVEIDGVKYTDIWLSTEAAEKFRVNAWDFNTAYDIASNTDATYASGEGWFGDYPVFQVGNTKKTQQVLVPAVNGNYTIPGSSVNVSRAENQYLWLDFNFIDGTSYQQTGNYKPGFPYAYEARIHSNPSRIVLYESPNSGQGTWSNKHTFDYSYYEDQPFEFDYVAGQIPANQPLSQDTGMMIRVPTEDVADFIDNHIEFQNNAPVNIDFELNPDLKVDIDDLFDVLAPILADLDVGDIQFIQNHESPAPVINNLLPDTYKQEILQPITENFYQTQETINNMGDSIIENIPKIDEICNNIDTAPYHDLDTGIDHLPSVFLPFIVDLRSALGIWHYVTEWIGQIGTTFAFVSGCLVGTSIMTPIYAAIAGFMCIKVYRRMTG